MFLILAIELFCVYLLFGYSISQGLFHFYKVLSIFLARLIGFGVAPLLVSLSLYGLYIFFPAQAHQFYYSLIIGLILIAAVTIEHLSVHDQRGRKNLFTFFRNLAEQIRKTTILEKLLFFYIASIIFFVAIRLLLYPTVWGDLVAYTEQGYVYHQYHAYLDTPKQNSFFQNGLYHPILSSIRPAIPVLYSLSFGYDLQNEAQQFSFRFLYFYYFILVILLFFYFARILKVKPLYRNFSLSLLISSFYLIRFMILGFKEIIIIYLALLSLILLFKLRATKSHQLLFAALLGLCLGLNMYINYSGIIIGSFFFLLYGIFLIRQKQKFSDKIKLLLLTVVFCLVASGGEVVTASSSFILNRSLFPSLGGQPPPKVMESNELSSYHLTSKGNPNTQTPKYFLLTPSQKSLLLKGKLQGFTQIQFYGLIFYLFLAVFLYLIITKKILFDLFDKLLLSFIAIYLFVFFDPFFLNPHAFSYILAISPKYTIILIPFLSLFVMRYLENTELIWKKLKWFIVIFNLSLVTLLIPIVRNLFVNASYQLFSNMMPIYQDSSYYLKTLSSLSLIFGISAAGFSFFYLLVTRKTKKFPLPILADLWILLFAFIIPNLILLNNNFLIVSTFENIFSSRSQKLISTAATEDDKDFFSLLNFLNQSLDSHKIILSLIENNLLYLYLHNTKRLLPPLSSEINRSDLPLPIYIVAYNKANTYQNRYPNYSPIYQNSTYLVLQKNPL